MSLFFFLHIVPLSRDERLKCFMKINLLSVDLINATLLVDKLLCFIHRKGLEKNAKWLKSSHTPGKLSHHDNYKCENTKSLFLFCVYQYLKIKCTYFLQLNIIRHLKTFSYIVLLNSEKFKLFHGFILCSTYPMANDSPYPMKTGKQKKKKKRKKRKKETKNQPSP